MNSNDIDGTALEYLENDFHNVLRELSSDQGLERFRVEYNKLYEALLKSHTKERELLQKCRELNRNISENAQKIRNMVNLAKNHSQDISKLKTELHRAKSILQVQKERDSKSKATIDQLTKIWNNLEELTKDNEGNQSGRLLRLKNLIDQKKEINGDIKDIRSSFLVYNNQILEKRDLIKENKIEKSRLEDLIRTIEKNLIEMKGRIKKDEEWSINHKNEKDVVKELKNLVIKEKYNEEKLIKELKKKILVLDKQNLNATKIIENLENEKNSDNKNLDTKKEELWILKKTFTDNIDKREFYEKDIKKLNSKFNDINIKYVQLNRNKDKFLDDIQKIKNEIIESDKLELVIKGQLIEIQREIDQTKKLALEDKHSLIDLKKEQHVIYKNFNKLNIQNKSKEDEIWLIKKANDNLKSNLKDIKKNIDLLKQKKNKTLINKYEREKETIKAISRYKQLIEESKLKDNLSSEISKKNIEIETKLKQQKKLYEEVRANRNQYSKNLTETQDEIAEIKKRSKIVTHQIAQLKEEKDAKEKALYNEINKAKEFDKNYHNLEKNNDDLKKKISEKEQMIKNFNNEIGKLKFIKKDINNDLNKLRKKYEDIVSERDILGTHLIRRNDELALIYEKIKLQQTTLAQGESKYRDKISDIDILKNTINYLKRELKILTENSKNIEKYKTEINKINKELIEEKLKVKALSEELENPKNKYRCRNLPGVDSDIHELETKIQNLQIRLINKTEEVVSKDLKINTQEQTVNNIREVMKGQPGLKEAETISLYQQKLKKINRKLKALAAELNMYQAKKKEHKFEINQINHNIEKINRDYYEEKRKEQLLKNEEPINNELDINLV